MRLIVLNRVAQGDIMEERIQGIMQDYLKNVEDTCNILLEGINYSEKLNLKTKKALQG